MLTAIRRSPQLTLWLHYLRGLWGAARRGAGNPEILTKKAQRCQQREAKERRCYIPGMCSTAVCHHSKRARCQAGQLALEAQELSNLKICAARRRARGAFVADGAQLSAGPELARWCNCGDQDERQRRKEGMREGNSPCGVWSRHALRDLQMRQAMTTVEERRRVGGSGDESERRWSAESRIDDRRQNGGEQNGLRFRGISDLSLYPAGLARAFRRVAWKRRRIAPNMRDVLERVSVGASELSISDRSSCIFCLL